jgi:hypothetical protein
MEKYPEWVKAGRWTKAGRADYCSRDTRLVPFGVKYRSLLHWKLRG